jgi:hypothetical protein
MTIAIVSSLRRLPCWIESFVKFTAGYPSPEMFRKWAAIATIAGALERRVWLRVSGLTLYPNLYTVLIGPPGIGKTVALLTVEELWRSVPDFHVAPNSVTKSSLLDALGDSVRKIVRMGETPPFYEYHSLLVASREMQVLLPEYDQDMMGHLQDLWDCGPSFEERRRSETKRLKIVNPVLNIVAGTTPGYLTTFMPAGAWDQGFMARMLMIYSGEVTKTDLDLLNDKTDVREDPIDLKHDLKIVAEMFGRMVWNPQAAELMKNWHRKQPDRPEHPKLQHYNTRRHLFLLKLCMVSCAANGNSMMVGIEDFQRALNWLTEAERYMPDTFKAMVTGGDSNVIDECWNYVWTTFSKEGNRPVAEHRITYFLQSRVPAHSIMKILETMVRSNMLDVVSDEKGGRMAFKPVPRL